MRFDNGVSVQDYYDRNTRRFLRYGHGARARAIHRAVWGPGVSDRDAALAYVNRFVARQLDAVAGATRVLDLGCGVGGTLFSLERSAIPGGSALALEGVTISSVQAELGQRLARSASAPITIREGDYSSPGFWSESPGPYGLVYAIESLVHVRNYAFVLSRVAERLAAGGRFVLIDDMLGREVTTMAVRHSRSVDEFVRGWHAGGLARIADIVAAAESSGLTLLEAHTLTPWLELGRLRDVLVSIVASAIRLTRVRGPWFDSMLGGAALQRLLRDGVLGYYALVFGRTSPARR